MEKVVFVDGGLGKQLMAARAIWDCWLTTKEKSFIVSGWPDVWRNHPGVEDVAHFNDLKRVRPMCARRVMLRPEPYGETDYRLKGMHLVETYRRLLGVKGDGNKPFLSLEGKEIEWARKRFDEYKKEHDAKGKAVAFMPFGGTPWEGMVRSLPLKLAQRVVDFMVGMGWCVFQFRGPTDVKLKSVVTPDLDIRYMLALLSAFDYVVTVDTWMQHAAVALEKKPLVIWGASSEVKLGYTEAWNIRREGECKLAPCERPEMTIPDPFVCPYDGECLNWDSSLEDRIGEYLDGVS